MTRHRAIALAVAAASLLTGTLADRKILAARPAGAGGAVLIADFHVHAYPIDGTLPRWEIQRDAARRGLDVVAITNHNQALAGRFLERLNAANVIALAGQEITTPGFHMIAVGITKTIDWRLSVEGAIAEIHRQGGVAIAAHPVRDSWRVGGRGLRDLDGVEAAHGVVSFVATGRAELDEFYARTRAVNHDVAPIGSSDFHFFSDMGLYRTYVVVNERSAQGVMDAIRRGHTVAADADGNLFGDSAMINEVWQFLAHNRRPPDVYWLIQRIAAHTVLFGVAGLIVLK